MTQIPISEIPEEGLPLSYSEEAAELDLAVPGARFLQPIAVDLVLVKAAGEISAHGRIKTSVMCECAPPPAARWAGPRECLTGQSRPGRPGCMKEGSHAESQTQAFEGAARQAADGEGQDPSPQPLRLPAVPPTETPALHLSELRDLQRSGSHRRRRSLTRGPCSV